MMYKIENILAIVLISVLAFFSGCNRAEEGESKFSQKTADGVYENAYFDFTITLPDGWFAQDYEGAQALSDQGGKIVAGDDENLQAVMETAEENSVNLFGFFEHPVGAPVPINPNVLGVAENVKFMPGITKGSDYLFHAKSLMAQGALDYKFDDKIGVKNIDGIEFDVMDSILTMNGMQIRQRYYAAIYKRYAVCFVTTYTNDENLKQVSDVIDSIKLDWDR